MEILIAAVTAGLAAASDLRKGQIPNALVLAGALPGIIFILLCEGAAGLPLLLIKMLWPFLLLIGLWWIGGIGGGDVKLLMALSIYFSVREMLLVLSVSFVLAAGFAAAKMIVRGEFLERILHFGSYCAACVNTRTLMRYESTREEGTRIHFAVFVLMGIVLVLLWEVITCRRQIF